MVSVRGMEYYILINVVVIFIVNFIKLDSKWLDINMRGHVKLSASAAAAKSPPQSCPTCATP